MTRMIVSRRGAEAQRAHKHEGCDGCWRLSDELSRQAVRRIVSAPLRLCVRHSSIALSHLRHGRLLCQRRIAEEPTVGPAVPDAAKIVGSDQCAKCHQPEVQQWMQTPHFATFETLHRTAAGEGDRRQARAAVDQAQRRLHAVPLHEQNQEGRERVVAGVSCESCHGGAADWLALHADYGGERHHARRRNRPSIGRSASRTASPSGMNNPHNIYLIAQQCYDCHTVPNEKLVNVGGHLAGSQDFELVAWSQGMVRHNFVRTGGTTNAHAQPGRAARDVRGRRD